MLKIVVFDSEDILDDQNFSDVVGHEIFIESTVFTVDRNEDLFSVIKRDLAQWKKLLILLLNHA